MEGLSANLAGIHVPVWGFAAVIGLLIGTFFARRGVAMGTAVLILLLLMWSMFIGVLPIVNNLLQPEGFSALFSRGIARFFEDAAPQAVLSELPAHRNEVLLSAAIAAVSFAVAGLVAAVTMREDA